MAEVFSSMAYPLLACFLLAGIHVYLGIHVIERKVIFVDLALAQIAALGVVFGSVLGFSLEHQPVILKVFSLCFTFMGAAFFSATRTREERVPHEAIIGIAYAVALSAMILLSANLPHGADEIRSLMSGSILWVDGATLSYAAALYAVIGLFHYKYRKQFLKLSMDLEGAKAEGLNVKFWDFWFYVSFGFVVTSSVSIAGVLLVFAYLIIPSVAAVLMSKNIKTRLLIGWSMGAVVSFVGVIVSYYADLPSGPTIVVCLAIALGLLVMFRKRTQSHLQ